MSEKTFTIVVCTYNGEKYIEKCLNALLALDGVNEHVEEIKVVDNNSTDHTKEIIQKYQNLSSIIKYEFEGVQGLTHARRHAVSASTPWVIYVDDDNILDKRWLDELEKTIKNKNIGVVNGAVIAEPFEPLTETERAILHAMYRNLACTHITEPNEKDKNNIPMGAGMCVLTVALKEISKNGWLNLEGRKGTILSSGEDTELCARIFSQGYEYCFNPSMKLYHLMPKGRLSEDYSAKLIHGLVSGRVQFLKNQKSSSMQLFMRKIKHYMLLVVSDIGMVLCKNDINKYWKNKVNALQAKEFIKLL